MDVAASVEVEKAGDSDGKQTGEVVSTISSDDDDSQRAEAVQLAADSQHMHSKCETATKRLTCVA